jgi:DNA-binding NarL/FixJ family response regulator
MDWRSTGIHLQEVVGPRVVHIAIAGRSPVLIAGVAAALEGDPQLRVVAQGLDVDQLMAWNEQGSCDVYLFHTAEPSADAARLLPRIRVRQLHGRVLVLASGDDVSEMFLTVGLGVHGYGILAELGLDDIRRAVLAVASDRRWACEVTIRRLMEAVAERTRLGSQPPPPGPAPHLSAREIEVLRLLSEGKNEVQIATELFLTRSTVRTYLARIRKKLGVHSRSAAVGMAIRYGLLPDRRAADRGHSLLREFTEMTLSPSR